VTSKFLAPDKYHEASSILKIHIHLVPWYIILLPRWAGAQDLCTLNFVNTMRGGLPSYLAQCFSTFMRPQPS